MTVTHNARPTSPDGEEPFNPNDVLVSLQHLATLCRRNRIHPVEYGMGGTEAWLILRGIDVGRFLFASAGAYLHGRYIDIDSELFAAGRRLRGIPVDATARPLWFFVDQEGAASTPDIEGWTISADYIVEDDNAKPPRWTVLITIALPFSGLDGIVDRLAEQTANHGCRRPKANAREHWPKRSPSRGEIVAEKLRSYTGENILLNTMAQVARANPAWRPTPVQLKVAQEWMRSGIRAAA